MFRANKLSTASKEAFNNSLEADKIQLNQVLTAVTAIIYATSIPMDFWALPSVVKEVFFIRLFIVSILVICFTITTVFKKFFLTHYAPILVTTYLSVSFAVAYSIHLAKVDEIAYTVYSAVLVIGILNFFTWTYLSTRVLLFTTALIMGGYILAIVTRIEQGPYGPFSLVMVTLSIMSGAAILGCIGKLVRDKNLYEKFSLQQSLEELLEKKRIESKTHEYQASHDSLTKLPNRRYIEKHLSSQMGSIQKDNKLMVVLFLDLNGFKKINDDLGHIAGDFVLKVTANRLAHCINKDDNLVRLGGDEFLVFITIDNDISQQKVIESIIERINLELNQGIKFEGRTVSISTSIGVSKSGADGYDINRLIEIADKRMYDNKKANSNQKTNKPSKSRGVSFNS